MLIVHAVVVWCSNVLYVMLSLGNGMASLKQSTFTILFLLCKESHLKSEVYHRNVCQLVWKYHFQAFSTGQFLVVPHGVTN